VVKTLPSATTAPAAARSQLVKDSWDDDEEDNDKTKTSWDDADDLFGDNKKPKEPIKSATPKSATPKQSASKSKPTTAATKTSTPAAKAPTTAPKTTQPQQKPSLKGAGAFDPLVDKLQKQKLVERSDLANTKDLFGVEGDEDEDELPPSVMQKQTTSKDLLESFAGRTEADFDAFAAEIALRLLRHEVLIALVSSCKYSWRSSLVSNFILLSSCHLLFHHKGISTFFEVC